MMASSTREQMERFDNASIKLWDANKAGNKLSGRFRWIINPQFNTGKDKSC